MSVIASRAQAATADRLAPLARVGLVLVGAAQAEIGIWGTLAPHSFFTTFPGAGHHWVASLGAYNEHLVRDYAAAELGLCVLLLSMAVWFERRLVLIGGVAFLAATLPHFVFHLIKTESLSTADNVASLAAFALELALVLGAMVVAARQASPGETAR